MQMERCKLSNVTLLLTFPIFLLLTFIAHICIDNQLLVLKSYFFIAHFFAHCSSAQGLPSLCHGMMYLLLTFFAHFCIDNQLHTIEK